MPRPGPAAPPRPPQGATQFRSSFESGEPQPDWTDTVDTGPDGKPRTSGVTPETAPAAPGMNTGTDTGPRDSPTAKAHAGFTGGHALRYAGTHTAHGRGYSYNRSLTSMSLSPRPLALLPDLPGDGEERPAYPATHAAVDLAFTDGTYLSELAAATSTARR